MTSGSEYSEYARRLVADWPPFTEEQKTVLRTVFAHVPLKSRKPDEAPTTTERAA